MFCIEVSGEENTGVYAWTCPKCGPSTWATPGISPDLQTVCTAATPKDAREALPVPGMLWHCCPQRDEQKGD